MSTWLEESLKYNNFIENKYNLTESRKYEFLNKLNITDEQKETIKKFIKEHPRQLNRLKSLNYKEIENWIKKVYFQKFQGIGCRGPAGGIVFYDKGYYSEDWRYLEAAPEDIGKYIFGHYRKLEGNHQNLFVNGTYVYDEKTCTREGIGEGKRNTELLVKTMKNKAFEDPYDGPGSEISDTTSKYAARVCLNYKFQGYKDWFLPSKDELNLMYERLYLNDIGNFADDYYWSSSEFWWGPFTIMAKCIFSQNFSNGKQDNGCRFFNYRVRPIRAF